MKSSDRNTKICKVLFIWNSWMQIKSLYITLHKDNTYAYYTYTELLNGPQGREAYESLITLMCVFVTSEVFIKQNILCCVVP